MPLGPWSFHSRRVDSDVDSVVVVVVVVVVVDENVEDVEDVEDVAWVKISLLYKTT